MRSKSDFWLDLHRLAGDLEKEGATLDEQADSLLSVLESLPATTLTAYLDDLGAVITSLQHLEARCKTR